MKGLLQFFSCSVSHNNGINKSGLAMSSETCLASPSEIKADLIEL